MTNLLLGAGASAALHKACDLASKLAQEGADAQVFDECVDAITAHVESLKLLVDEFSNFARLPTATPTPDDLNRIVSEAVSSYAGTDGVTFENSSKLEEYLASFDGPVVVHCGGGNRVGALLALRQSQKGDDDETAVAYGKKGGLTRLEPKVREVLGAD